jgi:hypothetical protein
LEADRVGDAQLAEYCGNLDGRRVGLADGPSPVTPGNVSIPSFGTAPPVKPLVLIV